MGGSTAGRLLNCPASYGAVAALPPSAETPSEYSLEGTAMHACMALLMTVRKDRRVATGEHAVVRHSIDTLLGRTFHDRPLTREHIDTMIMPALAALDELEVRCGGNFRVIAIEAAVRFPGLAGIFGTVDLVLQSTTHVLHVDWKFGQGLGVKALYEDEDGELLNPQLMFYITAAKRTYPSWYRHRRSMVGAIIQPRGDTPLSYTPIGRRDIKQFTEDLHGAVINALSRNPVRRRGEHCRFAPCKVTCPLWTGPLLDLAALKPVPREAPSGNEVTAYGEYLARAKALVDGAALLKKTVDEQLHAYLSNGGKVPGWRLKAKAKARQWVDEATVYGRLKALGFQEYEIWAPRKLNTFTAVDATAKRLGVTVPEDLRIAPPSGETTIATTDDPAPVVEPQLLVEQFRAALKQLQGA